MDRNKKRGYFGEVKRILFMIGLLLMAVGIFEFYPAVRYFRLVIPEDVYVGKACNCQCIAASRPWYSTFNYWYWLCIVIVPLLIFSIPPNASKLQKLTIVFISAGLCYLFMNLAVHLFWDIRNGPFIASPNPNFPWQKTWDMECANIGDGASLVFTLIFGWILASLYAGFCYAIRPTTPLFLKKRKV